MIIERRSDPIRTLSLANSKSNIRTVFWLTRAALSAASLTRFARSAPEKPAVPRAIVGSSTSSAIGILRVWTERMPSRPFTSGRLTTMRRSKRPGTQERRIEHVGTVGGGDEDDAFVRLEAVHLDEELVERLLALVVSAAETRAAVTADRVDFVDEDDARRVLLALLEQIADAAGADADEHLDEVRSADREERHVRFAGDGAREQRLAGAGRAHQQHALRNASAEFLEFLRLLEELDDLDEFFLGLVDAGDVLERHFLLRTRRQLRLALAEAQRLVAAALHLAHEEQPEADDEQRGSPAEQERRPRAGGRFFRADLHLAGHQLVDEAFVLRRHVDVERLVGFGDARDVLTDDLDLGDAAGVDPGHELGETDSARSDAGTSSRRSRSERQ